MTTPEPRRRRSGPPDQQTRYDPDGVLVVRRTVLFVDEHDRALDVLTIERRYQVVEDGTS